MSICMSILRKLTCDMIAAKRSSGDHYGRKSKVLLPNSFEGCMHPLAFGSTMRYIKNASCKKMLLKGKKDCYNKGCQITTKAGANMIVTKITPIMAIIILVFLAACVLTILQLLLALLFLQVPPIRALAQKVVAILMGYE